MRLNYGELIGFNTNISNPNITPVINKPNTINKCKIINNINSLRL